MIEFLETICIEDGNIVCLQAHEDRMNATRKHFWPDEAPLCLASYIMPQLTCGRMRCRVLYGKQIKAVTYHDYTPRKVSSLQCIEVSNLEYSYKYANRSALDELYAQRGTADDVLLVRHGWLTDTTITNIALWNGYEWHTPESPLLNGTHRKRLLQNGKIKAYPLRVTDLVHYEKIVLFNAMLHFGEVELPVSSIRLP